MDWDQNSDILEELRRISLFQKCLYFSQYQFQKSQSESVHPVCFEIQKYPLYYKIWNFSISNPLILIFEQL